MLSAETCVFWSEIHNAMGKGLWDRLEPRLAFLNLFLSIISLSFRFSYHAEKKQPIRGDSESLCTVVLENCRRKRGENTRHLQMFSALVMGTSSIRILQDPRKTTMMFKKEKMKITTHSWTWCRQRNNYLF